MAIAKILVDFNLAVQYGIAMCILYVTDYKKRDHLGFFIKIEFLACMNSFVYAAYNSESSKKKH